MNKKLTNNDPSTPTIWYPLCFLFCVMNWKGCGESGYALSPSSVLKMEKVYFSEMLVSTDKSTWHQNTEKQTSLLRKRKFTTAAVSL